MAFSTFSGSNSGNRAFQLNGEILGGVVVSGTLFGGLPVFTGSTGGIPIGAHAKYALSRSFADNDASGSIIQALNYLEARAGLGSDTTFLEVNNALQESTGSVYLGDPSRTDNALFYGDLSGTHFSVTAAGITKVEGLLSASDSLVVDGASIFSSNLTVSGAISSSAGSLIIGGGTTLSNALSVSGTTTLAGDLSSSAGATFLGGLIATTLQASSSLLIAGNAGVTGTIHAGGNISGAADIAGQELKIQAGSTITGSSVFHGAISGGLGATFVEGVIASTLEASSSIFCGASVVVTGASGFVLATALQANQTIVASTSITGTTGLNIGGEGLIRLHNNVKEPLLNVSGAIFVSGAASANPIKLQLGQSAASCSLDMIPYIQTMGVDEEGKLRLFKLQISGGMFQVSEA